MTLPAKCYNHWLTACLVAALLIPLATGSRELFQAPLTGNILRANNSPSPASTAAAAPSGAAQPASYASISDAIDAASTPAASNISTLMAAIKAADVASAIDDSTAWTILAPTNEAFESRLEEDLGISPNELLQNRTLLATVLSYHVISGGAYTSSQLIASEGRNFATLLASARPLTIELDEDKGGVLREVPRIVFQGETNNAKTTSAVDIVAGKSVIHVVNDVLLPAGIGKE
eukprot:GHRR01002031.1.p1 GENE.GHRR01002031.1~~GHRR01002031.1.p1  ORF type:complete len:233 (+),score=76.21 GHRR01002031.1:89-787(+)